MAFSWRGEEPCAPPLGLSWLQPSSMNIIRFRERPAQIGDREARALGGVEQDFLAPSQQLRDVVHLVGYAVRDDDGAVAVGMNEIVVPHDHSMDRDRAAEIP